MISRIREKLLYTSIMQDADGRIHDQILKDNRKAAAGWSALQSAYWILCLIIGMHNAEYTSCRSVYLAALCINTVTLIVSAFAVPKVPKLITPVMFIIRATLIGVGIGTALCLPYTKTVTFVAALLIAPIMFVDNTLTSVLLALLGIIAFMLSGSRILPADIYNWMLQDMILYSTAGVLIGHFMNKTRFERYELLEQQFRLAYYDQMTGLKNRRAYSDALYSMSGEMPKDICVIMADINGLKTANDTIGHEAGDELIIGAAECLKQAFSCTDNVFRIGGDEFCVIMKGSMEDAQQCIDRLEEITASKKGRYIDRISISCGAESCAGYDNIETVVKEADSRMYESKDQYYITSGKDRRK